jgi:hypothetical protein
VDDALAAKAATLRRLTEFGKAPPGEVSLQLRGKMSRSDHFRGASSQFDDPPSQIAACA